MIIGSTVQERMKTGASCGAKLPLLKIQHLVRWRQGVVFVVVVTRTDSSRLGCVPLVYCTSALQPHFIRTLDCCLLPSQVSTTLYPVLASIRPCCPHVRLEYTFRRQSSAGWISTFQATGQIRS